MSLESGRVLWDRFGAHVTDASSTGARGIGLRESARNRLIVAPGQFKVLSVRGIRADGRRHVEALVYEIASASDAPAGDYGSDAIAG